MSGWLIRIVVFAQLILLFGCAELNSIHRKSTLGASEAISVDAKQRFIFARKGDGDAADVICAEPSPDVFSAFAASLSGEAQTKAFEAAMNAAISENAATIGIRTQSIQLLRDSMYRACEALQAGAIKPDQFAELHRRFQRIMVTLVAIEQLTQAVQPQQIVLTTKASNEQAANINRLQEELTTAKSNQSTAKGQVAEKQEKVDQYPEPSLPDGVESCEPIPSGKEEECKTYNQEANASEEAKTELQSAKNTLAAAEKNVEEIEGMLDDARKQTKLAASGQLAGINRSLRPASISDVTAQTVAEKVTKMVAQSYDLDRDRALTFYGDYCTGGELEVANDLSEAEAILSDIGSKRIGNKEGIDGDESVPGKENTEENLFAQTVTRNSEKIFQSVMEREAIKTDLCRYLVTFLTNEPG